MRSVGKKHALTEGAAAPGHDFIQHPSKHGSGLCLIQKLPEEFDISGHDLDRILARKVLSTKHQRIWQVRIDDEVLE